LEREVDIMKKVGRHPHIVQLIDLVESPNFLYLVMELVTGGALMDRITGQAEFSEGDVRLLVLQIVSAIEVLHKQNIVHRDLKPENILLKEGNKHIMITDFGLSRIANSSVSTVCGTPYYVAPEVISQKRYDKGVDMWSVGVVTYLMLFGFPPFFAETMEELFEQINEARYEWPEAPQVSPKAKDFIKNLLVIDPTERMTAENAVHHAWLIT